MNYREVIKDAFWITLRNRFLSYFGLLLSGGQVFSLLQNANNLSQQGAFSSLGYDVPLLFVQARRFVLDNLILFLVLAVLLVLVGIFLSSIARGALIDGVAALHRGEERNFSSAFRAGLSNFWRVLGLSVLVFIISLALWLPILFLILFSIFGIVARTDSSSAGVVIAVLAFLFFFVVSLLIFVPLGIIFILGLQALVLNREGVFGSLGSSYRLLVRRPGRILLVAAISFGLGLGASVALLMLALLLGLLLAVPALILFAADLSTAGIVAAVVASGVLLILYLIAASAVATFNYAYWTLAYLRLTGVSEAASDREA